MMILNLSGSLAKPLVLAKLNMAYSKFLRPAQRYDDFNLSGSLAKPLVLAN